MQFSALVWSVVFGCFFFFPNDHVPNISNTKLLYLFEFITIYHEVYLFFSTYRNTDLKKSIKNPLHKGLKLSRYYGNSTVEYFTSAKHFTSKDLHETSIIPDKIWESRIWMKWAISTTKIYLIPHKADIDNVEDLS